MLSYKNWRHQICTNHAYAIDARTLRILKIVIDIPFLGKRMAGD